MRIPRPSPAATEPRRRRLWSALALGGLLLCAWAADARAEEPHADTVPGGIALVHLRPSTTKPTASYHGREVMVIGYPLLHWQAVVGIPLSTAPGRQYVHVLSRGWHYEAPFDVQAKHYATEHITLKNKRQVNPTPADLKRIAREGKIIDAALAHWTLRPPPSLDFIVPLHGVVSSPFGLRRVFNGEPRHPHSGLDIAAPAGTPIRAPLAGTVLVVGDFFFTGNTVLLDHGQGLITLYCHMSKVLVKEGQDVTQGQEIGEVGMTGRATGPHTHWGVSLNNAMVNPELFFPSQAAFKEELQPPASRLGAGDRPDRDD